MGGQTCPGLETGGVDINVGFLGRISHSAAPVWLFAFSGAVCARRITGAARAAARARHAAKLPLRLVAPRRTEEGADGPAKGTCLFW